MSVPGRQHAVFFPDGGRVGLDLGETSGSFTLRWLNVAASRWEGETSVQAGKAVALDAPGGGGWVALLTKVASGAGSAESRED